MDLIIDLQCFSLSGSILMTLHITYLNLITILEVDVNIISFVEEETGSQRS